jgi:drug/metabolite transporter (DMT)-like permease
VSVVEVTRSSRAWIGIAVAIAAGAAFAIANTSAGVAYWGGSNPLTVASTRFLLPTAALIGWLGFTGVSLVLPRREAIVAVLLGALTAIYNWALLRSFNSIPFALAVLIIYFYPLIAAVIVATFGWEKFSWKTGAAILLAIIGLALALNVRGSNLNVTGVSLAFVAAARLAVVVAVSSRVFGNGDARPVTLYMSASASVFCYSCSVQPAEISRYRIRQAGGSASELPLRSMALR